MRGCPPSFCNRLEGCQESQVYPVRNKTEAQFSSNSLMGTFQCWRNFHNNYFSFEKPIFSFKNQEKHLKLLIFETSDKRSSNRTTAQVPPISMSSNMPQSRYGSLAFEDCCNLYTKKKTYIELIMMFLCKQLVSLIQRWPQFFLLNLRSFLIFKEFTVFSCFWEKQGLIEGKNSVNRYLSRNFHRQRNEAFLFYSLTYNSKPKISYMLQKSVLCSISTKS